MEFAVVSKVVVSYHHIVPQLTQEAYKSCDVPAFALPHGSHTWVELFKN